MSEPLARADETSAADGWSCAYAGPVVARSNATTKGAAAAEPSRPPASCAYLPAERILAVTVKLTPFYARHRELGAEFFTGALDEIRTDLWVASEEEIALPPFEEQLSRLGDAILDRAGERAGLDERSVSVEGPLRKRTLSSVTTTVAPSSANR